MAERLARLFHDAAKSATALRELAGEMSPTQLRQHMADPHADYRGFYHRAREIHMPVSPATGRLLYMLARAANAHTVVEYGTSYGISTIHLAAAVADNGGGLVIGSEFEPGKVAAARANLEAVGLDAWVQIREGDAIETLARDIPAPVDLVLLDGHKGLYARILELLRPRLRPGTWLVADNADACPAYLAHVRAPEAGYLSVPFADDVELTLVL